jgi:hypothetical protein
MFSKQYINSQFSISVQQILKGGKQNLLFNVFTGNGSDAF